MSTPTDAPPSEGDEAAPALAVEEVPTATGETAVYANVILKKGVVKQ